MHPPLLFLSLLLGPAVAARFSSAITQRQFLEVAAGGDGRTAVASLGGGEVLKSSTEALHGDVQVAAVPGTNIVLLDCANAEQSRDVGLAVNLASVLVCDVLYSDLLRGSARLTALQYAIECTLASNGGAAPVGPKKCLHVACIDCEDGDADSVKGALDDLIKAAWRAAAKPDGSENFGMSDLFEVHFEALPHRKRSAADFRSKSTTFMKGVEASGRALSASELWKELESVTPVSTSTHVAPMAPTHSDALANVVCNAHLDRILGEFLEGFPDLRAELGGAFDEFGELCDASIRRALARFDELVVDYDGTSLKHAKIRELQARLIELLEPIYQSQVKQLEEVSWDRMRKKLVKLKVNDPTLMKDMEVSIQDADTFFRDTVNRMVCKGSTWSSDLIRREMVADMRRFVGDKLQGVRLQGAYVPGMQRRPIAVSLFYLATKPFQLLDALQDSLSYEEDMDWEPDFSHDDPRDSVVRSAKAIPAGVSAMTGKWVRKAEMTGK